MARRRYRPRPFREQEAGAGGGPRLCRMRGRVVGTCLVLAAVGCGGDSGASGPLGGAVDATRDAGSARVVMSLRLRDLPEVEDTEVEFVGGATELDGDRRRLTYERGLLLGASSAAFGDRS